MENQTRPKILIVEDTALIAGRMQSMLEEMGYQVPLIVSSGEEALKHVARLRPDLILMDIRLSGEMDGVETAEHIRIRYEIPVIFLTGSADDRTLERASLAEPLGYLVKPFVKQDLISAIVIADHKRRLQMRQREGRARFRVGPAGQILFASDPLAEMLGYRDGEALTFLNLLDLWVDGRECWEGEGPLIPCGIAQDIELQLLCRDGTPVWVSAATLPVCNADGEIAFYEGSMIEITKWKRAEQQLRRRAAHLEALNAIITKTAVATDITELLNSTLDHSLRALGLAAGTIWVEGQNAIRGFSENGRTLEAMHQVAGESFPHVTHVEDWQLTTTDSKLSELARQMAAFGFRSSLIVPIMANNRTIGGINLAAADRRAWSQNEITFLETLGHQLGAASERLRLLETIREQVLQVHQIIHAVPEGVLLLGAGFHILMANPVGREYLSVLSESQVGDSLSQLGGRPLSELMTSPLPGLWHQIDTGHRCFETITRSIEPGPETAGWVLVIRDVTQRQSLQQRMQRQDRLAAVGQLAAGIAHDLNNIFTVINIHAQLAMDTEGLSVDSEKRIATVLNQGERGSHLIEQILDFSRQTEMDRKPLTLTPLIKEAVKLLQHMLPENIELSLSHGTEAYMVKADPTRLQQVFMNLAINARDSMPDGGTLQISLEHSQSHQGEAQPLPEMKSGDWVHLVVKDSGTGIPADVLPNIFDPFFTTKGPGKGTGLGLAQVHGIVEQHEGHIDVKTAEGAGTTFTVYLPAIEGRDHSPSADEPRPMARGDGELVMVVEDEPATRRVLFEGLQSLNYRVREAVNGRQALEFLDQNGEEPALILTDLVMPEMGGKALLNALAERGWSGRMIVISGHPLGSREEEGIDAENVSAVLTKPVRLAQLAEAAHAALREYSILLHP